MKVTEHLNRKSSKVSFEILPPMKGAGINSIYQTLDPLMEFAPPYINITYHREELTYIKTANGREVPGVVKKRPGTVGIAAAIQNRYQVDVVPHLICGGFSRVETEDALIDLDFLGINNLLVVRGDADKITGEFRPHPGGHTYAVDLLKQLMAMNRGEYIEQYVEKPYPTNFSTGVAAYPEKHQESPNAESDLQYLKEKVEAGADYIVTQLFFDNKVFYDFCRSCREAGINVPIIPGIKPLAIRKHLCLLPKKFGTSLPRELTNEVLRCKTDRQVWELGVEWSISQAKELLSKGAPIIHLYTMGRAENIKKIAKEIA